LRLSADPTKTPLLAVKAVQEANGVVLRRIRDKCGPSFLRDLRVAADWSLPFVAATDARSAPVLVLLEELGVDLGRRTSRLASTVAHVAAYHANLPALRILRTRGYDVDAPNSHGDRPVKHAQRQRHDTVVAWFRRHGVAIPEPEPDPEDY